MIRKRHRKTKRQIKKQRKIIIISLVCFMFIMVGGYSAFQTNLNITAKGNIKEKSRVIQSWTSTSNEDFHTDYYRENIVTATFLDNNNVPENATESWNVSEDKTHGGVMAWVVPNNEDNTKYDLYIGANGGVIANEDSGYIFRNFISITSIDFNNNFDTNNITNMASMFYHCKVLTKLDLSGFNTANVTNMTCLFDGCTELENVNLSSFDTSKVTTMQQMFYGNTSLTELDLSNFNTENLTNMYAMFMYCTALTKINLCSFDTSKVTNMNWLFYQYSGNNLQNIYVGDSWTTENAETIDMFKNSKVSSVTTGQCS